MERLSDTGTADLLTRCDACGAQHAQSAQGSEWWSTTFMRAIGSMGHTVMVSSLFSSYLSLIQMSTLNRLDLEFASVLSVPSVCGVCLLI